jgi:hypothetical protein
MRKKEKDMSSKKTVIALAIAILISAGFAVAAEAEFTIVNTAILPASSLSLSGILPVTSPVSPAPAAPMINVDPQRDFGGFVRGEKFESALFTSSLVAMTALNVADYLSTRQALKFSGLQEGNPLMKPFVKNPALFAAVKAGTTALSLWGMNKMFRKGNKTTAWVLTMASNFILSYVVSNNMRLIQKASLR